MSARADLITQFCLKGLADRSGLDETNQAPGERLRLRPGRQPDSQPAGGDMIDNAPPRLCLGDAVGDQALVEGQVRERAVFR